MMKTSYLTLIIGVIVCQLMAVELYSQDLPESWVNPPPDPADVSNVPNEEGRLSEPANAWPPARQIYPN